MKLYTEDIGNDILKLFADIPTERQILGAQEELPALSFLESLNTDDKTVIVSPEPLEFNEQDNDAIIEQTYKFNVFIFNKLGDDMWVWKDRFILGQELVNKIGKWAKGIEGKYKDDYFNIKIAQVTMLDYSAVTIRGMSENDVVKLRLVAVAVQVRFDCEFDNAQYLAWTDRS